MHTTYITLDGRVLDLSSLTEEERAYLDATYRAYLENSDYDPVKLANLSADHPTVRAAGGRLTREVWDNPLWQATRDLEDRIGIRQRRVGPNPGDNVDRKPFGDTWISVQAAATQKGVAVPSVHYAIDRGDLIARSRKQGGRWLEVSVASLARWQPSAGRQRAGRAGAAARRAS